MPRGSQGLARVASAILVVFAGAGARAGGGAASVSIEGGVSPDNPQLYGWTVTNHYNSAIVSIEFPQYHGDTFIAPADWSQTWKNRAAIKGGEDAPGWIRTNVSNPALGIPPGGSAQFELRVARAGALPRPAAVTVRFADGSIAKIPGVEVPSGKSLLERNAMLIGMIAIVVLVVLVRFRRQRKPAATPPGPEKS